MLLFKRHHAPFLVALRCALRSWGREEGACVRACVRACVLWALLRYEIIVCFIVPQACFEWLRGIVNARQARVPPPPPAPPVAAAAAVIAPKAKPAPRPLPPGWGASDV